MIKCEICGGTENVETFSSSLDFIRHNICRKCAEMSNEDTARLAVIRVVKALRCLMRRICARLTRRAFFSVLRLNY